MQKSNFLPGFRRCLGQGRIEELLHFRAGPGRGLLVPASDGPHADSQASRERLITQSQRRLQRAC
jgi:hypothetical protein